MVTENAHVARDARHAVHLGGAHRVRADIGGDRGAVLAPEKSDLALGAVKTGQEDVHIGGVVRRTKGKIRSAELHVLNDVSIQGKSTHEAANNEKTDSHAISPDIYTHTATHSHTQTNTPTRRYKKHL